MNRLKFITKENIFNPGNENYKSVHASTLERLPGGEICAAWFGGTKEKAPDVEIWFSKRKSEGLWTEPSMLSIRDDIPKWNPVLFYDEGKLFLFYKKGKDIHSWKTYMRFSEDGGSTWSAPELLVNNDMSGRGPVKNKPVKLSDGTILAGASTEDKLSRWEIFVDSSSDGCRTWQKTEPIKFMLPGSDKIYTSKNELRPKANGLIQPTLWEHPSKDGRVSLFARSAFGFIYRADSSDYGCTWSAAYPTDIPNNNSGIDSVMTENGVLSLVFNRVNENWGCRSPLNLAIFDEAYKNISDETEIENIKGEFSYPAIISYKNKLFITYTNDRKTITFAEYEII